MNRILPPLAGFVAPLGTATARVQSRIRAADSSQSQARLEAKAFTGTLLKSCSDFVLSDSATKI
jgi:hypothetical protein